MAHKDDNPKGGTSRPMYYDPYEQCPERSSEPSKQTISDENLESNKTESISRTVDVIKDTVQPVTESGTPTDGYYIETLKPDVSEFQSRIANKNDLSSPTEERFSTAQRQIQVQQGKSKMVVTANSAYQPASDYANMAEIRKQQEEDDDDDDDDFHEAYMDLEPGLNIPLSESPVSNEAVSFPIPMPRQSKTAAVATAAPVGATATIEESLYEEPWDLMHRRLELEERMKAASIGGVVTPLAGNERMTLASQLVEYDHSLARCPINSVGGNCGKFAPDVDDLNRDERVCPESMREFNSGSGDRRQAQLNCSRVDTSQPAVVKSAERNVSNNQLNRQSQPNMGDPRWVPIDLDGQNPGQKTWCGKTEQNQLQHALDMADQRLGFTRQQLQQHCLSDDQKLEKKLDNRLNNGYDKPWDLKPHGKDDRGQEGYEKPWDLKPHLKDERPSIEYETPWDKKARELELMASRSGDGSRTAPSMHNSCGTAGAVVQTNVVGRAGSPCLDLTSDQKTQPRQLIVTLKTGLQPLLPTHKARLSRLKQLQAICGNTIPMELARSKAAVARQQATERSTAGQTPLKVDPKVPLELQRWYHGVLSRVEAENLLRMYPEGSFLVRTSESNRLDFSMSVRSANGFMHMKIVNQDSRYILGQFSQPFYTIPQMIYHYTVHKLPIKGAEHMSLMFPVNSSDDQLL